MVVVVVGRRGGGGVALQYVSSAVNSWYEAQTQQNEPSTVSFLMERISQLPLYQSLDLVTTGQY